MENHYQADNCSTKNEYIEKAVRFYSGYLDAENADDYLPRVLAETLDGKVNALGDCVGRLLFKQAVEDDMMMNLLAWSLDVDMDTLRQLRGRCVREVKETNGAIRFEEALLYQKGAR